jgi:hypothetical protein
MDLSGGQLTDELNVPDRFEGLADAGSGSLN